MSNRVEIILEALNRSDKAFAELMRDVKRAADGIDQMSARSGAAGKAMSGHMHGATQQVGLFSSSIMNASMKLMMIEMVVAQIGRGLDALVFRFNSTLETAGLGIATAFMTGGEYIDRTTGKALEGQQALAAAQEDSARMTERLQASNFATIATLDQLIRAYQETLPVALKRGFNRDQVEQFTVAMVQAAGAIDASGQLMHMLGEETRSLLTGAINPRTSRIATVLGITNEDVAKFKGNADGLFNFLMEKLSAYRVAGLESQKTWAGVWSNTIDIFNQMSAKVSEPLFETVKAELMEITGEIVEIDTATGKVNWNPDFLEGIEDTKEGVAAIIAEFYRLGMLIDKVGGTMTALGAVVTFGDWDKKFREWNAEYQKRYEESDRKLQELANRLAGLNSDGTPKETSPKSDYRQRPGEGDEEAIERAKKLAGEWERVKATLTLDVEKTGLNELGQKLADITAKAEELRKKFGERPEIAAWEESQKKASELKQEISLLRQENDELEKSTEGALEAFQGFAQTLELVDDPMAQITAGLTFYGDGLDEAADKTEQTSERVQNAVEGWASGFSGSLNDMLWSADLTFDSILESFGRMITQMIIQMQVVEPMMQSFGPWIGNLFSGLFGGATSTTTDGGFTPTLDTSGYNLGTPKFHDGGKFVPRFHFGGLSNDEGFAVLKAGERTFDPDQTRIVDGLARLGEAAAGSQVEVNVINNASNTSARAEERQQGGKRIVDVIIETVEGAMSSGRLDRSLGSNYGVSRAGIRR